MAPIVGGGSPRWPWKFNCGVKQIKRWLFCSIHFFWIVPAEEFQTSRVATPQTGDIYLYISLHIFTHAFTHVRGSIPCRTKYIECKPRGEDSSIFWGRLPNSIGFRCKVRSFIVLRHRSWGVPLGELEKIICLKQSKKKLIISGDHFFDICQLRSFRHPGLLFPKGNSMYVMINPILYIYPSSRPHKANSIPINPLQTHIHRIWCPENT